MRTRIKICGITRVEDAAAAASLGADAVGLIFYDPSPRVVSIRQAARIADSLPALVHVVGVFVWLCGLNLRYSDLTVNGI